MITRLFPRASAFRIPAVALVTSALALTSVGAPLAAQSNAPVTALDLSAGRSLPISVAAPISKVTVANPEVADVVVIGERDVVVNAVAVGETDVILWSESAPRRHYRVRVRSNQERRQVLLGVKFAEVRKDALVNITSSLRGRSGSGDYRAGSGRLNTDDIIKDDGSVAIPGQRFLTLLSTFNSAQFLWLLDGEEQRGNARVLAEPNLMAADQEEASFLAGGEVPIPVVQGGVSNNNQVVTIQFREYGIRLTFRPEILSDSLLKLKVRPEVSSLDFGAGVTIAGFNVPSLRTRRIESTVDLLSDRSLVISGLFNEERERVKTGIPFLVNIPILGDLLSSQRWLRSESELIIIVTPIILDPNNPRDADMLQLSQPDSIPAAEALKRRLPPVPPL